MSDLTGYLNEGRLDLFVIAGLCLILVWVVKQWRDAEKGRLEDLKKMVELATEVKNSVATLVELVKGERGSK